MRSTLITFVLLLSFHAFPSYAQKELWSELSSGYTGPGFPIDYPYGAIVKTDSIGNNLVFVHVFDSLDGRTMVSPLLQASNGIIYGITRTGGTGGDGTLFQYDPVTDSFRVLINFGTDVPGANPANGLIEASPGLLYGTYGDGESIFTYDIATATLHFAVEVPTFISGIVTWVDKVKGPLYKASDGYIYGTTSSNSSNPMFNPNVGTIFRIDPATNIYSMVYAMSYTFEDGASPNGGFVETGGKLYTTTVAAGAYALGGGWGGTIIEYDMASHAFTKKMDLSDFITDDSTGTTPTVFTKAGDGKFYGYAYSLAAPGPIYEDATLFEYDPATNIYTHKYDFYYNAGGVYSWDVGFYPMGLMQASNGKFYGATHETGVFEYDAATDSMRPTTARLLQANWQSFIEICRKPAYKYYSNTNDTACLGGSFQFDLHNTNAQTYTWVHNGITDPAQTTGILSFASFTAADSGTWACTLTNECGVTTPPAIHIALSSLSYAGIITGASAVCTGSTITLSDTAAGGAWSSSNTTATVSGGIVTGATAGMDTITYIIPHTCGMPTKIVTVNPLPGSAGIITGAAVVCAGSTIALSDTSAGGVWSSSATAMATVGSTGVVTGIAAGSVVISYSVINVCGTNVETKLLTINPLPVAGTITGASTVCPASLTLLSDAATGGVWSSSATSIATVGSAGAVTEVSAGTTTISYSVTNSCGTAVATKPVTVGLFPVAGTITGASSVCQDMAIVLSDAATGGTWSSSATAVATVTSTGAVTGLTGGIAVISYTVTNFCGTAAATATVTVNPVPVVSPITGDTTLCVGSTTLLSDTATGGTWNSSALSIATISTTGVVTGVAPGTSHIVYYKLNACGAAIVSVTVTVISSSSSAGGITGAATVCAGAATLLSDTAAGGIWSSSAMAIATIGSADGTVTGATAGSAVISYAVTNACGTAFATTTMTVDPLPVAGAITGAGSVCTGDTIILADVVTGGAWSSSATSVATVDGTGVVTGVTAGGVGISYSVTNACGTVVVALPVTVNTVPVAGTITGGATVCEGATLSLGDIITGGVWGSSNTTAAVSAGTVTGITAGTDTISYFVANICGATTATQTITIDPLPVAGTITGVDSVCAGETLTLSDIAAGGIWSSSNTAIAMIGASGTVTGVSSGAAVITYTVANSCDTATAIYPLHVLAPCTTGLNVVITSAGLMVYPNPNTGTFTVEITSGTDEGVYIIITNLVGEKIKELTTMANTALNITLEEAQGIYLLSAITPHGRYEAKLAVIK